MENVNNRLQDASDCIAALPGWIEAEIKKAKGTGK